ncbi:MAG: tripartite tricarboxylate transporter substrate binding protein [Rhodocyclaceae bacterium]|jgi:tripartite-type tricarboxylate transporter receptor subunit TctC|nr:tripartite tricarboxylate transporter substrate binding protein [Rhodocyclaceae bacterium]MCA3075810.1 tripartite tricarboxylate transporter substrate binding protein [Rhodocyclaceae bacterium]MCA3091217.1 tripartite tricarboxylate transporter substrate binding protein [Rhodocyclaceae bacterium]MCA3095292.1 tripartite tricarboxylate transporter substrate binding protein [Rhodocyclaceae bacterium]MCA3099015.1 tripartite tricarboxylate transporter substrate binding protein [Rhodocyclaceae bact
MSLSRIIPAALGLAGATLVAMPVLAQPGTAFPAKPVRIIVPFAPGGQSDIISRVVGQKLSEQWGQPMVYENRGGAGGTLGIDAMLRAPADGYTIGSGSQSALSIAQHLYAKLPYDPLKEVQGVVTLVLTPYAVAVNARVPVKDIADLVRLSRAKPGLLNFGSSGAGSISHIAAELFGDAAGTRLVHVPYKGTAPALAGLATGEIDLMFSDLTPLGPHIESKRARVIAIAGSRRSSAAPGATTLAEQGFKMQAIDGRYGFVVPAATPRDVVNRINAASVAALKMADVRNRFETQLGYAIVGDTPEDYQRAIRNDSETFGRVIKRAGIKAE